MPEPSVEQEFKTAVEHHQAARLPQAEEHYRRVLAHKPNHADALHLLGVIAAQVKRFDAAVELIDRAIAISPGAAEYHGNLANALKESGQLDKAIDAYRRAIRLNPNLADAHDNLGIALKEKGAFDESITAHRRAVAINPAFAQAHADLGSALAAKGQFAQAIASYRESLRLNAASSATWNNLGIALAENEQIEEAIAAYRKSLALKLDHEAQNNLAGALAQTGRLDDAIEAYRLAARLKPSSPDVWSNFGLMLREAGRLDEAIAASARAVQLNPDMAYPHWNMAQAFLQKGDYENGWPEYEWRWRWKDFPSKRRNFPQPQWLGEALHGRTILLHAEQGLGDVMQFVRYAPLVAGRGGRVLLECPRSLARLFRSLPDVKLVFSDEPLPAFDVHCPLMSLPLAFGTLLQTIPTSIPYLHVDPDLIEAWSKKLNRHAESGTANSTGTAALAARRDRAAGAPTGGLAGRDSAGEGTGGTVPLRVGLAWAGNPRQVIDHRRSITLQHLAPLARAMGVTFYSLQLGYAAAQTSPPAGMQLVDLTSEIHDFADTAALISNLDLVVSTCTSVAHLAGALGKKTWVLLAYLPDWRWLLDREDSPWYPTMRLFRQPKAGDWAGAIERVSADLARFSG